MSKKRKHRDKASANVRVMTGAQFGWDCEDPLEPESEIINTWINHRNPITRMFLKKDKARFYGLTDKKKLKWKIKVECEFKMPTGKIYYRGADLVIHGILREADGHYQDAIEDIFNDAQMSHYVTTHVTAEILGNNNIIERDFKD